MPKKRRKKRASAQPGPPPEPMPLPRPRTGPRLVIAAVVFMSTLLLFFPTWKGPFVLDDLQKIEANPDMRVPFSLRNFVYPYAENATDLRNDPSRPFTYMVYWLCWHAGSGSPLPFHVANTLLHGLAAALLALLIAELVSSLFGERTDWAGGVGALLFLTSPLMAGTVAYVTGLSDILSGVLILASLLLLVRHRRPGARTIALAGGLLILALASKQSAIVLPALVAACDLGAGGWPEVKARARVYLPLILVAVAYLAAFGLYFGAVGDVEGRRGLHPAAFYASMQGSVILSYFRMIFLPSGLTIDHLPVASNTPLWLRFAAWTVVAVLSGLALREVFRPGGQALRRLFGLGWLIFLVGLLPTSSFLPTVDLLVERRAYLAGMGIFLAVAALWWRLGLGRRVRRGVMVAAALVLVVVQGGMTWQRMRVYGSPEALWRESLDRNRMNRRALVNLGTYYSRVGRWDDAVGVFERVLAYAPGDGPVYSKLAYVYMQPSYAGRSNEKALEYQKKGLELNPDNVFGFYNAAVLYLRLDRLADAEAALQQAIRVNPHFARAYGLLGEIALRQDRRDEAIAHFQEALRLDPSDQAAAKRLRELAGR